VAEAVSLALGDRAVREYHGKRIAVGLPDVQPAVEAIIEQELAGIHEFGERLPSGELPVC
jgi:hypothetical protein